MKQVDHWRLPASLLLVVVLTNMAEQVNSQPIDINSTVMGYYCSQYKGMNAEFFLRNLNATISSLRRQISITKFAAARTLFNGESVWGLAWCRGYLSIPDCLNCFDYAVTALKPCGLGNGAHVIYSDCEVRYENSNFYTEADNRAGVVRCGDTSSIQPTDEFRKAAEKSISDLQIAVPRKSDFYAVSSTKEDGGNGTVYAIAQSLLEKWVFTYRNFLRKLVVAKYQRISYGILTGRCCPQIPTGFLRNSDGNDVCRYSVGKL